MSKKHQTFTEAVQELEKAQNELILAIGEALGLVRLLEWLERKLRR